MLRSDTLGNMGVCACKREVLYLQLLPAFAFFCSKMLTIMIDTACACVCNPLADEAVWGYNLHMSTFLCKTMRVQCAGLPFQKGQHYQLSRATIQTI